jgi:hypothetical protein
MLDLLYCDVFGFDHLRYFKREGTEFPVPFKNKNMSRLAFSCRHSLMTGMLLIFITPLFYGPVSLGRFLYTFYMTIAIFIGIHFEEKELAKAMGKGFAVYKKFIPNLVIPDFSVLISSRESMRRRN